MKLGIIGLPQSGKTTIFNALTGENRPTTVSGKMEVHTAVVNVPDERVNRLSAFYNPKKTTYAKVTYADIAGLDGRGQGDVSGSLRNELGTMDGFIHVARCFENDSVPHIFETIDPARDISNMDSELLLSDLVVVERKLERLTEERKKGGRDKGDIQREEEVFTRLQEHLNAEKPLRTLALNAEDLRNLSGYQFLTLKPMLVVLNLSEGQSAPDVSAVTPYSKVVALQGQLEMEIAQLSADEAAVFLEEYGIAEPSLYRMIRESYDLMGLQSFFTVGEDEVRAWTIPVGTNAHIAAGTIHSDLMRGFIRAEAIAWDTLLAVGGLAEARQQAKLRIEGKDYILHDGEVMHVRFNV